jgi:ABC-type sugar transport system ATPase subunit
MADLNLINVAKSFGNTQVVHDLTVDFPDRAFVSLLGPSGCGKSTTLNMIAGLEKVDAGKVVLEGIDITSWAPHERQMAMVFQNYALYPHMDVYGNLAFSLKLAKRPKAEIDKRIRDVSEMLEIGELLKRRVGQLSGGQQQRVALARALVKEPMVFLFDEPLSNLDAALRNRTRIEIKKLHLQVAATSIFVTHDQEEAMMLSDLIVVMRAGDVEQVGSPGEIYRRPANKYVASFVGNPQMNLLDLRIGRSDGTIAVDAADFPLRWTASDIGAGEIAPSGAVTIGIRSEDLRVVSGDTRGPDTFSGVVTLVEPRGADSYVEVAAGAHQMTVRIEPEFTPALGETLHVQLPANKLHLFDQTSGARLN